MMKKLRSMHAFTTHGMVSVSQKLIVAPRKRLVVYVERCTLKNLAMIAELMNKTVQKIYLVPKKHRGNQWKDYILILLHYLPVKTV